MCKDKYEQEAKDHLISELKQRERGDWNVAATDVEVDPITHINFDYQLQFEDRLIALEVFRLVESKEEIERSKSWSLISNKIAEELVSRGVKGYTIRTPYSFNVPKNKIEKFVSKIADKLQTAVQATPHSESIHESGCEISWIKDFQSVSCYGIGPGGAVNPTGEAFDFIKRMLPKKNKQLNIADHSDSQLATVDWSLTTSLKLAVKLISQDLETSTRFTSTIPTLAKFSWYTTRRFTLHSNQTASHRDIWNRCSCSG
jgi:hypothetical protein